MKKRLLSILLALVMVVSLIPTALAASESELNLGIATATAENQYQFQSATVPSGTINTLVITLPESVSVMLPNPTNIASVGTDTVKYIDVSCLSDVQSYIRGITFNTQNAGDKITIGVDSEEISNKTYYNGHFYEFVDNGTGMTPSNGDTWENAKTAAENKTFLGNTGYLATITSAAEQNAVVVEKGVNNGAWIGGEKVNGTWYWVQEPGSNNRQTFNSYTNWAEGEPSNDYSNEKYLMIYGKYDLYDGNYHAVEPADANKWNDMPASGDHVLGCVQGYVAEYSMSSVTTDASAEGTLKQTQYNIKYELAGGTNHEDNPSTYTYGVGVGSFGNATKEGYTFEGWYSDENFRNEVTGIGVTESGDKTLYANYTCDVTFKRWDENNKEWETWTDAVTVPTGSTVSAEKLNELAGEVYPAGTGIRFDKWIYQDASENEQEFTSGTTVTDPMVVYADFEYITHTVTFQRWNDSGPQWDSQLQKVIRTNTTFGDNLAEIEAKAEELTDRDFSHWTYQDTDGWKVFTKDTLVTGDMTVFANYTYTVTFKRWDESTATPQWQENWEQVKIITESTFANDAPGKLAELENEVYKDVVGYKFTKWTYQDTDGTWKEFTTDTQVNSHMTVFAEYKYNTYTVKFDANTTDNVTGIMAVQEFTYNTKQALTANSYVREGWGFLGWSDTPVGAVKYTDKQEVLNLTAKDGGEVSLYAVWAPEKEKLDPIYAAYQVEHYLQNADGTYPETPYAYTTNEKTGIYLFEKVGTEVTAELKDYSNVDGIHYIAPETAPSGYVKKISKDDPTYLILKVYYGRDTHTVTFDSNGGSRIDPVAGILCGNPVAEPDDPVKRGYIFEGWYDEDGNKYDFDTPVTADITLTAKWTRIYYPVATPDPTVKVKGLNTVDHVAYIIGVGDDKVNPLGTITRAEVAAIYFRLMTDEFRNKYWSDSNSYTDVADTAWYNVAVSTLEAAGVIKDAAEGGQFRPNDPITRAELAVMAAQFCTVTGKLPKTAFKDVDKDHWAYDEINLIEYAGWIEGYENYFRPDDNLTRAECVTIVNRMLQRGAESENMLEDMVIFVDNLDEDMWYYAAIQEAANSHTYTRTSKKLTGEEFRGEKWTTIEEAPDWAALEKTWAETAED